MSTPVAELRCQMREAKLPRGWKTEAAKLCQQITRTYQDNVPVDDTHKAFLLDLLERHPDAPEKKGPGILAVTVQTAAEYGTRHFTLHRTDGTSTDFSWRVCITPPVYADDCKQAMRMAISPQIRTFRWQQFKENPSQSCELCGTALSRLAEVDHADPRFRDLAEEYATAVGGWQAITLEPSADKQTGRTLSPGDLYTWRLFHQQKAVLRLLCGACNRKRH